MREFAEINKRIELVSSLASVERDDARVLAEIGDVLNAGYAAALQADALCRRLAEQAERRLMDGEHSAHAGQFARERQTIAEATRRLRDRLAMLRTLFAEVSARVGSA